MIKKDIFGKNEDIYLSMECFEDELSPTQIRAYENEKKAFNESTETLKQLINNGELLYENDRISVIYTFNTYSSSEKQQIVPHEEQPIFHSNDATDMDFSNAFIFNNVSLDDFQHPTSTNYHSEFETSDSVLLTHRKRLGNSGISKLSRNIPPNSGNKRDFRCGVSCRTNKSLKMYDKKQLNLMKKENMFPSLVVEAKPNHFLTNVTKLSTQEEKFYLEQNMTTLFTLNAEKFIEWLLKQGLIQFNQFCRNHENSENSRLKIISGVNEDSCTIPCSTGFVWVSDCCPNNYISIFKGSLFEGCHQPATVIIRLLYHWSCQINVNDTMQSMKLNMAYLKTFYTNLRGVCVAAIHEDCKSLLGGRNKMVEVGFVSLGLGSKEKRVYVKVWILGVMDSDTKRIRMIVIKRDRKNNKKNSNLLLPLTKFVSRNSIILTDLHWDRSLFTGIGFNKVYQSPIHDPRNKKIYSNENIMNYLKSCLPPMFGNMLTDLSRPLIQQFLDELCWREKWGTTPLRAFNALIFHIRKQTQIYPDRSLSFCLSRIATYPFMNWQYTNWKINFRKLGGKGAKMMAKSHTEENEVTVVGKPVTEDTKADAMDRIESVQKLYCGNYRPIQSELTELECYYYGTLPANTNLLVLERKCTLDMKCALCGTLLKTNICIMEHLIRHIFFNDKENAINDKNSSLCKYCLKQSFQHSHCYNGQLRKPATGSPLYCSNEHNRPVIPHMRCLICEQDFRFRTKLIVHMHFFHNETELPYECGICKFRSSQHHIVIDHFYETHNNGEKVQCPLCLKIVALKDNGFNITQNMYFFLNHLKKHSCEQLARKCNRCVLSFVNKGVLEYHQRIYHKSCNLPGVKRYNDSSAIMMPLPAPSTSVTKASYNPKTLDNYISMKYTHEEFKVVLDIGKSNQNALCCECEGFLLEDSHFLGDFSCLNCPFKTCCDKSMFEHVVKFHTSTTNTNFNDNRQIILNNPMYCLCGFKSVFGNELATHLVNCGKTSVYSQEI